MDLNTFFCNIPVYVINLKSSSDRRESVINEFKNYKNVFFIDAIDGRKNDFSELYKIFITCDIKINNPTLAVICSHIKAIKKAYDENLEYVCIFEDDVHTDLIKTCNFTLKDICNLNNEWEAIQLFYTSAQYENLLCQSHNDYLNNGLRLLKRENTHSGTCYILNKKGINNFINNNILYNRDLTHIIIKNKIVDPEHAILGHLNSFIINRQVMYYYFDKGTFDSYTDTPTDSKNYCQLIHLKSKEILCNLYAVK